MEDILLRTAKHESATDMWGVVSGRDYPTCQGNVGLYLFRALSEYSLTM